MRISGRNHLAWGMSAALSFSLLAVTAGAADDKSQDRDAADADPSTDLDAASVAVAKESSTAAKKSSTAKESAASVITRLRRLCIC